MDKQLSLQQAAKILNLSDTFSLVDLERQYRTLLKQYHPDACKDTPTFCEEKTKEIIEAYKRLQYVIKHIRFSMNDLEHATPEEFWMKRFSHDGVWGKPPSKS